MLPPRCKPKAGPNYQESARIPGRLRTSFGMLGRASPKATNNASNKILLYWGTARWNPTCFLTWASGGERSPGALPYLWWDESGRGRVAKTTTQRCFKQIKSKCMGRRCVSPSKLATSQNTAEYTRLHDHAVIRRIRLRSKGREP